MASIDKPNDDRHSEDQALSSGRPFDIVEPVERKDVTLVGSEIIYKVHDAEYVKPWNPIPRLKQLWERLFPPR
jgi:hypothetical protein